jgi:hypothetical protein
MIPGGWNDFCKDSCEDHSTPTKNLFAREGTFAGVGW